MTVPVDQHPEVLSSIRVFEAWASTQMAYRGLPGLSYDVIAPSNRPVIRRAPEGNISTALSGL